MGRFLTADEVRNDANSPNPQSWNLYPTLTSYLAINLSYIERSLISVAFT
jgi:hypothetical protein